VYRRDQGRTIWLTCNWNAPMEECASTTNPQVGIKYERSIYLTSGRCLSGNFLQHSNTDKLSVSLKSCVCVCVCVYIHAKGQFMTLWLLNIGSKEFWSLLRKDYLTTHTHQPKRSHYICVEAATVLLPLLRGSLFWGLHWSHVQTHMASVHWRT